MMDVKFEVLNMEGWVTDISSKYLTTVAIVDCVPWHRTGGQAMFEIAEGKGQQMIEDVRSHPDIEFLDVEERDDGGGLTGTIGLKNCTFIRLILWAGCFLEKAYSDGDGKLHFYVLAGSDGSIPVLIRAMGGMNLVIEVKGDEEGGGEPQGHEKAEGAVKLALERGYFDYLKKIDVKELAAEAHISPSTCGEILRRAQKNILLEYFERRP